MNKSELISAIAANAGITKADAKKALDDAKNDINSAEDTIRLRVIGDTDSAQVLCDGKVAQTPVSEIVMRKSEKTVKFLRLGEQNFYRRLKEKLSEKLKPFIKCKQRTISSFKNLIQESNVAPPQHSKDQ